MSHECRCWVAVALGAILTAAVLAMEGCAPAGSTASGTEPAAATELISAEDAKGDWPMFGGSIQRNLANTVDKGILDSFGVTRQDRPAPTASPAAKDKEKNIKWKAALGSMSFGGPVIAGGRVFVGTN